MAGLVTLGAPSALAQNASDENIERAQALFAEAEEAYSAHRYATAADLFRQVHELMVGHPRQYLVLFNLGQCLADAGEYAAAIAELERYLEEGGDRVENRGEVELRIRELRELMGGDEPAPGPSGPDAGLVTGAVIGFAVGGLGLLSMGIFGGLALAEHDALAGGCGATRTCTQDDIATSDTFALVADISLGVGAAGVATGLALLVVALTTQGGGEPETAGWRMAPWVTANGAGMAGGASW